MLCYLPNMSSFCIGSISWCYFVVLLFRWCSPVSADPLFPSDLKFADVTPVYNYIIQYFQNLWKMYLWSSSALFRFFIVQISMRVLWRLKRTTLLDKHNRQKEENYCYYYYYYYIIIITIIIIAVIIIITFIHIMNLVS